MIGVVDNTILMSKDAAALSGEGRALLHGLYRRLRENGEDKQMIRRALSVFPMEQNIATAKQFLAHHRRLVEIGDLRSQLRAFHVLRKVRLFFQRKQHLFALFRLRLKLASLSAISDVLVYLLCCSILFFLYQMYRLCRVGLTKAEEKYQTLAIPIIQTIEALELTEKYRHGKPKDRNEMDEDIVRQRKM